MRIVKSREVNEHIYIIAVIIKYADTFDWELLFVGISSNALDVPVPTESLRTKKHESGLFFMLADTERSCDWIGGDLRCRALLAVLKRGPWMVEFKRIISSAWTWGILWIVIYYDWGYLGDSWRESRAISLSRWHHTTSWARNGALRSSSWRWDTGWVWSPQEFMGSLRPLHRLCHWRLLWWLFIVGSFGGICSQKEQWKRKGRLGRCSNWSEVLLLRCWSNVVLRVGTGIMRFVHISTDNITGFVFCNVGSSNALFILLQICGRIICLRWPRQLLMKLTDEIYRLQTRIVRLWVSNNQK